MSDITELVNWRGGLINNPNMVPLRPQYNFGPFEVGGFDHLLIRQRSIPNPEKAGKYGAPQLRIGVQTGGTIDIGAGNNLEPLLELSGLVGYPDPTTMASTAERGLDNDTVLPHPELRWQVPVDAPYALIGIASPAAVPDGRPLELQVHGVTGGTAHTHPHQYGNLELLRVSADLANNDSVQTVLPPFGGRARFEIETTSADLAINMQISNFSGTESRFRYLYVGGATPPGQPVFVDVLIPWKQVIVTAGVGPAGAGHLSLTLTEDR